MSGISEFIKDHWLFCSWLGYSLLCLITVFITHPILLNLTDNLDLLACEATAVSKLTKGDLYSFATDKETPSRIDVFYVLHYSGPDFMCVQNHAEYGKDIQLAAKCSVLDREYDVDFKGVICATSKYPDIELVVSFDDSNPDFLHLWNSGLSASDCSMTVGRAQIRLIQGSWFHLIFFITTYFGAAPFLGVLFGLFVVAVVYIILRGYLALPWPLRFAIWIVGFPILIIVLGAGRGGSGDGDMRVFDKSDNVIGHYDKKDGVYRDSSGKIRSLGWWKKK